MRRRWLTRQAARLKPLCPKKLRGSNIFRFLPESWTYSLAFVASPLRAEVSPRRRLLPWHGAPKWRPINLMTAFVTVNGRILDLDDYRRDFAILKKLVGMDAASFLNTLGFIRKESRNSKWSSCFHFSNTDVDMDIVITVRKWHKLVYV
jgi:hypothetical protein